MDVKKKDLTLNELDSLFDMLTLEEKLCKKYAFALSHLNSDFIKPFAKNVEAIADIAATIRREMEKRGDTLPSSASLSAIDNLKHAASKVLSETEQ